MTDDAPADRPEQQALDAEFVGLLACPSCHDPLVATPGALRCDGCGRTYPVQDGVPVLLVEEASCDGQSDAEND